MTAILVRADAENRRGEHRSWSWPLHLRAILDALPCGVATFDADARLVFGNAELDALLDIPDRARWTHASLGELLEAATALDGTAALRVREAFGEVVRSRQARELELDAPEPSMEPSTASEPARDRRRSLSVRIETVDEGNLLLTVSDTSERKAAEARALAVATCDPLTGLLNRVPFHHRLGAGAAQGPGDAGGRRAVMAIDLDRFKHVNDTLGHAAGDELLRLVARRLRSILHENDVVARLGGDEFAVMLPGAGSADAAGPLAERIVDVLGRPYLVHGHLVNIGASVGVALGPEHGEDPETLMRSADLALYDAKANGRNASSMFHAEMDARASTRRRNEIDLRKALVLDEFLLHYQPQVDLERGSIVGFEALLRWQHPERGMVSPADFIPLAEEIGLIVPLGEWVLEQACARAAAWPEDVSVAVNVSPHQFEDAERLVRAVTRALEAGGLPGRRLEIEITESALLRDAASVLGALHRLRGMGVRVALDDFGTGYSSLSQLNSFPFDRIKIDRAFVRDRADNRSQNAFIRAIAALGQSLGMDTVAEGVETGDQLARIRAGGCTSVQGYLFSRPVGIAEVETLIARFNAAPAAAR